MRRRVPPYHTQISILISQFKKYKPYLSEIGIRMISHRMEDDVMLLLFLVMILSMLYSLAVFYMISKSGK